MKIEMFVSLKITDNTAVTARNAMRKMGFDVKDVKRYDYYSFDANSDVRDILSKVDVLVNVNKHNCSFSMPSGVKVLVKDEGGSEGLLKVLRERLGLKEVENAEKGMLWVLDCDEAKAKEIAKKLLCNEHYQEYEVLP